MMRIFLLSGFLLMWTTSVWANDEAAPSEDNGVTLIDAQTVEERLRPYLLPLPDMEKENQADAELIEFINQRVKWEKDD